MSMELMVRVMKVSIGDPLSKLVLLKMADNASDDGYCWPSYQHIADQCEMDRRTAMRHVDKLCVCGFLKKELRKGAKGNTSNAYRLTPDNGSAEMLKKLKPGKKPRQKASDTETLPPSVTESPGVVTQDHHGSDTETLPPGVTESPESVTLLKQSLNQSLNPTHNTRGGEVEPANKKTIPEYPGQPGIAYPAAQPFGKFPMSTTWAPSADFRQRAAYWGSPVGESLKPRELKSALASFADYWISEGKVFSQTQWEQKFARHLQNTKPTQPRGNAHAELDKYPPTANAAQRRMLDARAAQLRERGQNVAVLGSHDGSLFQPVDGQKRIGSVGPMDCSDWEFDQRPDDERL